jgi:Putative metallopeptidase
MRDLQFANGRSGYAVGPRRLSLAVLLALLTGGAQIFAQTPLQEAATTRSVSELFEAGIKQYARALASNPRLKKLSEQKREDLVNFVGGNMLFVLLHELGHAAMQEMRLPILGREEDQADNFAIIGLINVGNQISHRALVEAAKGWFLSDRRDRKDREPLAFYDEHGLDKQRAYNIVCLLFGSDPDRLADLAKETELPRDRQESCKTQDYPRISSSWDGVLQIHRRAADQPRVNIEVIHGDGKGDLDTYAQAFRAIRMVEIVAQNTSNNFAWPRPFVLEWQTCGFINARWVQSTRRLTLCYELAQDFSRLYRDFNVKPGSSNSAKSKKKSK